jgi:hypothetical protein
MHSLATVAAAHATHITAAECWIAVIAFLLGLLIGVHMSRPGYMR